MKTQPTYLITTENSDFRLFLDGNEKPADYNYNWACRIQDNLAAGKTMQRLKVVRRPFNDYTRYLFDWAIPTNTQAGEDYQILDLTGRDCEAPKQDFWLFDESTAVLLNFYADGTLQNRELMEPSAANKYLELRDKFLKETVPFSEYRTGRTVNEA